MADAYGGISIATSDDCVVNAAAFASALNDFRWDNSSGDWITCKDGKKDEFWYEGSCIQYPTTRPKQTVAVIVEQEDGELLQIPVEAATVDDWENCIDTEEDHAELKALSEALSPYITKGWIEIACSANEKNRYVYFENLRVYAGGKVESGEICSGCMVTPTSSFETYDPAA